MFTPNEPQLSSMNIEKTDNSQSSKLCDRMLLAGTPFTLVTIEGTEWFLALGKFKITEPKPIETTAEEDAIFYMETNVYNIMLTVTSIILQYVLETQYDLKPNSNL